MLQGRRDVPPVQVLSAGDSSHAGPHDARLLVSFVEGGDGGGPAECDGKYHSDNQMLAALSSGWYDNGSRCNKNIRIVANGRTVLAKVVDECDSVIGCEAEVNFEQPCPNDVVNASPAVWKTLAIPELEIGDYEITWSDA
ncbi:hypothetical protein Cni_G15814 [Canna indica]|uniref:Uncharacterized protein n=1 Tax=Canna indica TaxID=4628 RepID=A0AAQ3QFA9_9LILI|nr:hypothetical protein Cni_G15814 [Canna indica]